MYRTANYLDSTILYIEEWLEEIDDIRRGFDSNGLLVFEPIKKLVHHRENEPAKITYYETGQVMSKSWYKLGKFHNSKGPARIEYTINGVIKGVDYWLNGNMITLYVMDWLAFNKFPVDWENWNEEHQMLFYLTWSNLDPNDIEI